MKRIGFRHFGLFVVALLFQASVGAWLGLDDFFGGASSTADGLTHCNYKDAYKLGTGNFSEIVDFGEFQVSEECGKNLYTSLVQVNQFKESGTKRERKDYLLLCDEFTAVYQGTKCREAYHKAGSQKSDEKERKSFILSDEELKGIAQQGIRDAIQEQLEKHKSLTTSQDKAFFFRVFDDYQRSKGAAGASGLRCRGVDIYKHFAPDKACGGKAPQALKDVLTDIISGDDSFKQKI